MVVGYREKVFAIIGVKVYAAGLYVNQSILYSLHAWKGRSAAEIQEDSSLFNSIFLCNNHKKYASSLPHTLAHIEDANVTFPNCSSFGEIVTDCSG
mgnify:CR=1 FL=1